MLLFELEPVVDAAVNARAVATAAARSRARRSPGVRDVRATYRSVAVDYDPLASDRDAIAQRDGGRVSAAGQAPPPAATWRSPSSTAAPTGPTWQRWPNAPA